MSDNPSQEEGPSLALEEELVMVSQELWKVTQTPPKDSGWKAHELAKIQNLLGRRHQLIELMQEVPVTALSKEQQSKLEKVIQQVQKLDEGIDLALNQHRDQLDQQIQSFYTTRHQIAGYKGTSSGSSISSRSNQV